MKIDVSSPTCNSVYIYGAIPEHVFYFKKSDSRAAKARNTLMSDTHLYQIGCLMIIKALRKSI